MNKRLKKKKYRNLVVKLFEEMDERGNDILLIKILDNYKLFNYVNIEIKNMPDQYLTSTVEITCDMKNYDLNKLINNIFATKKIKN